MRIASVALAGVVAASAQELVAGQYAWGRCETYADTGYCALKHGAQVWIHDNLTQMVQEFGTMGIAQQFSQGSQLGSAFCQEQWKQYFCDLLFPPCVTVQDASNDPIALPQRQCVDQCERLHETCADAFAGMRAIGLGHIVPSCDAEVTVSVGTRVPYLAEWAGRPTFLTNDTEMLTTPSNGEVEVGCARTASEDFVCPRRECVLPYVEVSRAAVGDDHAACQDYTIDGSSCLNCVSSCELPCPLTVWSDGEWTIQWIARWLPGVLSIPLNLAAFVVEMQKIISSKPGRKKEANTYLAMCCFFGLTLACLDSVPVLLAKFDLKCQGYAAHGELTDDWSPFCAIGRFAIHVQQMLLAAVGIVLFDLFSKLNAARKMRQGYKQSTLSKTLSYFWILGIPTGLIAAHAAQNVSNGSPSTFNDDGTKTLTDMTLGNFLRYAFSCGPRFEQQSTEWLLIMAPTIMYGGFLIVVSAALVSVVRSLTTRSSSSNSSKGSKKATINLARKMLRFAAICIALVVLNLGAVVPFLSTSLEAAQRLEDWNLCATSGIIPSEDCPIGTTSFSNCDFATVEFDNLTATEERCGSVSEFASNPFAMTLVHLSYSLPLFAFAYLFGIASLKQLFRKGSSKVRNASTVATTSARSVAK